MGSCRKPSRISEFEAREARDIGLIADSHGLVDDRIVAALGGCDIVIHAGDYLDLRVFAQFEQSRFIWVAGNNDPATTADIDIARVKVRGGLLVVLHGHQFPNAKSRHERLRRTFDEALAVVYGHSHRRVVDQRDLPWVLNPGGAGRARTFGGPSALRMRYKRSGWQIETLRFEATNRRN